MVDATTVVSSSFDAVFAADILPARVGRDDGMDVGDVGILVGILVGAQ
jgi:hypothetical protein